MKRTTDKKESICSGKNRPLNVFILLWIFIAIAVILVFPGCSLPEISSYSEDGFSASYASVPLCGGFLSSGNGCSSCLWGESCRMATMTSDNSGEPVNVCGCDELYYGNSCGGCGSQPFYVYYGLASINQDDGNVMVIYSGATVNKSESWLIFYKGCFGCETNTEQTFAYFVPDMEEVMEYKDMMDLYDFINGITS